MCGCRRFVPILAGLSVACSEAPPRDEDEEQEVVARVAGETIARSDVEEFAAMLLPGLRSKKSGRVAKLEYLQTLIDEKLLVLEARTLGLDTTRAVKGKLSQRFRKHVLEYYRPRHLYPEIDITEAEVRDRFIQDGLNRERAVRRLVVTTVEKASQLREQIEEQGVNFCDLVKAHTLEKNRAARGGSLGFVNAETAAKYQIPRQAFDTLPEGRVSQPLPLGNVHQLLLFEDEREADFRVHAKRIEGRLWQEELALLTQAATEKVASELGLAISDGGAQLLLGKKKGMGRRRYPELTPREAAETLYTYENGEITVGDYVEHFRTSGARLALANEGELDRDARRRLLPDLMLWEAARREGYHELASMLEWKERETIDQLIKTLRKRTLDEQVVVTDEQAEQFYRDNPSFFTDPEEVEIQEILVGEPEQATKLRRRLDAGEEMNALIHLSRHPGAERNQGKRHVHSWDRSEVAREAFAAQEGELVGPLETAHGHSVFRVLRKGGGRLLPFPEVARKAATHVRYREEARVFNVLLADVREKHADQVQIFEEELREVELPAVGADPQPSGGQ